MFVRTFRGSFVLTAVALVLAYVYGGAQMLILALILGIMEVSLSFDNAVVNATVLKNLNPFWQKVFLTVGILIAVVGMRLIFPMGLVCITAHLSPGQVVDLAFAKGDPDTQGTYGYLLNQAHPAIAAFGSAFLLMLFLNFIFEKREINWLSWLEKPLARIGKLDQLAVVVVLLVVVIGAFALAPDDNIQTVLVAGSAGVIAYILVNALGSLFEDPDTNVNDPTLHDKSAEFDEAAVGGGAPIVQLVLKAGRVAFFSFLYLEVLDASFSFDGVIGAFAITSDPIIIMLGLGLIGATFVRSLTVYLVRQGVLDDYVYLEHGAQWAIGSLAVLLLLSLKFQIPEVMTGLIGVGFIGAALVSSILRNKRNRDAGGHFGLEAATARSVASPPVALDLAGSQ